MNRNRGFLVSVCTFLVQQQISAALLLYYTMLGKTAENRHGRKADSDSTLAGETVSVPAVGTVLDTRGRNFYGGTEWEYICLHI